MQTSKEMLKAADVAPLLGVTTGRVYQMIAEGTLPGIRAGRAVCVPRAAWERWLRDQSRHAEQSAIALRRRSLHPTTVAVEPGVSV